MNTDSHDIEKDAQEQKAAAAEEGKSPVSEEMPEESQEPKKKKHLIKPRWLRILLKTFMWVIIAVLLIPVALYIPPVQRFAVNTASHFVEKSTGMKIGIGFFRLGFPLDVHLEDVYVVEASKDTMVKAAEVVADVKLLPLLRLDVQLKKLQLRDGYYRMMAPDSSMLLKVNAGLLEVDDRSSADIGKMEILLNKAKIRDGRLSLYMDVWKKKQTPEDTASATTPILIKANDLQLENFEFGMSMLPTIDTLNLAVKSVKLKKGVVDLGKNLVKWELAAVSGGNAKYITPTAEWVKAHPAPPSLPSTGPPMRIMGDSIAVDSLSMLYATKGVKPMPGFDAAYIAVNDIRLGLKNFYNESSTVRLPITRLMAKERSGLQITSGRGTIGVDSVGLSLDKLNVNTLYSRLNATAKVPFAVMALDEEEQLEAVAEGRIGLADIDAFMPALKEYTKHIPARKPLDFNVKASGSLGDIAIETLNVSMPNVVAIKAKGSAKNAMHPENLIANLNFDGSLSDPHLVGEIIDTGGVKVPAFTIIGTADAHGSNYGADFDLHTTGGSLAAKGRVALTPENYSANLRAMGINVAEILPELGIGRVSADVTANGRGFNPLSGHAVTEALIDVHEIEYNKQTLRGIHANASLTGAGDFILAASSVNPGLDFDIDGNGTILPDDYTFDLRARMRDINLQTYGLTDTLCCGSGDIAIRGTASPDKWLYNVDADISNFDWNLPDTYIHLPAGAQAELRADQFNTSLRLNSLMTKLDFTAESGMENLVDALTKVSSMVSRQIADKSVAVDSISSLLPSFTLDASASGKGLLSQFLQPQDMRIDTVFAKIAKDSIIRGSLNALNFNSPSISLDTMRLNFNERGNLLDYRAHLGNRPGTLDEFATVNLNGYLGQNRVSAFLTQNNIKGEQGYKIGLTAALMDSVVTAHITPLKSTIAYLPWTFNNDNFVDYNLHNKHVEANLNARSAESSVLLKTQPNTMGQEELYAKIDNVHIEDFLNMWALGPQMKGSLNADMHITYVDQRFEGKGDVSLNDFIYEKTRVGDFDLDLDAGYGFNGSTDVRAALKINGEPAIAAYANLRSGDQGMEPDSIGVSLTQFPLKVANPFLGNMLVLGGHVNGDMRMDGSFTAPILNGQIQFDSVTARIPMADATLRFEKDPLVVKDNVVTIENFAVYGANDNPITLEGTVNARKFSDILFDLHLNANNFQLINSNRRSKGDLYGKIFLTMNASVEGPMRRLNVDGNVNVLGTTDATYKLDIAPAEMTARNNDDVVRFVNFNDTTQTAEADSIVESPLNMRINANLTISPGTKVQVLLSSNGTDKVQLQPTANLNYFQNYMGDMKVTGTLTLGEGYARYNIPVMGEKMFTFDPTSTVTFNGNVTDPILNVTATDDMKVNVTSGNNSRLVNFLVSLHATQALSNLKVAFDLSTDDDLEIQNELQSMTPDQRQTQAMNMLLYGQYAGQNTKTAASKLDAGILYSFLESQLNQWAAKAIRGVDLTFGIDQYAKTSGGVTNTETSYSYQVSKSLFNNRFKIQVGGNYSTDVADDEIAQNLISDVSLEYVIKQTQNLNMAVRLFRHIGYESILEGEITEMGAGFVMKRRLGDLRSLFRFGRRKHKDSEPKDTSKTDAKAILTNDSTINREKK